MPDTTTGEQTSPSDAGILSTKPSSPISSPKTSKGILILGVTVVCVLIAYIITHFLSQSLEFESFNFAKIPSTLARILAALSVSTVIFVGLNLFFDQPNKRWRGFNIGTGVFFGLLLFGILDANRLLVEVGPKLVFWPLLGAAIGAVGMGVLSLIKPKTERLLWGIIFMSGMGVAIALGWPSDFLPDINWGTTFAWTFATAAVLALVGLFVHRKKKAALLTFVGYWALVGMSLGWLLGAWGGANLGHVSCENRLADSGAEITTIEELRSSAMLAELQKENPLPKNIRDIATKGCQYFYPEVADQAEASGLEPSSVIIERHVSPDGSRFEALLASIVGLGLLGARLGLSKYPDSASRISINLSSRKYIFLAPALSFVWLGLLIPLVRTIWLSLLSRETAVSGNLGERASELLDRQGDSLGNITSQGLSLVERAEEFVWLENYGFIFTSEDSLDLTGGWEFFSSSLAWWGGGLALLALIIGFIRVAFRKQDPKTGKLIKRSPFSGATVSPMLIGWFLLVTAVFTTLRGTILNNLWWVFFVTLITASLGLTIAVLADRAKMETAAKSLIFMPMAISFVGASVIWRYMYIARPSGDPQTGVFNSVWSALGELSITESWTVLVASIILIGLGSGLLIFAGMSFWSGARKLAGAALLGAAVFGYLLYRMLGPGLGGITTDREGNQIPDIITFLENVPFNNVWLMVVLIWIQTGFAMVIFSAAIKAVPTEYIEAAKVDGASETQIFWRIILPQIATTVGVVITTLIVLVMKVYDIVKILTNGNFGTQVLASDMWQRAFTESNFGLGSALAVVLFISVIPIMYYNIRRMQKLAV